MRVPELSGGNLCSQWKTRLPKRDTFNKRKTLNDPPTHIFLGLVQHLQPAAGRMVRAPLFSHCSQL